MFFTIDSFLIPSYWNINNGNVSVLVPGLDTRVVIGHVQDVIDGKTTFVANKGWEQYFFNTLR